MFGHAHTKTIRTFLPTGRLLTIIKLTVIQYARLPIIEVSKHINPKSVTPNHAHCQMLSTMSVADVATQDT